MESVRSTSKSTILVVDDTPDNLALMSSLLKEHYRVKVANGGEKALRIAQSDSPPDLILLDIMMPDMDGYEVCRRLKRDLATMHIPVIFLTAKAEVDDEKRGLELGAVDYITKPISPPIVLARVKNHLALKAMADFLQEKNLELKSAKATAEKASLAKSDFLSSMSHELRSPLNAILGFGQLMETETPPPTTSQGESIAQILKAGWHLLKLIDEILDLAKVESGHVSVSLEPVSLAEVILECQSMIDLQAHQRGIRMIFPPSAIPFFVFADRTRVKQIFLNLLSNAIKYNNPGGTVEVECAEHSPGRIRVVIRDTGAGLNLVQISQLFQAFNRLGQEAGSEQGTGIGLVVAKQLIDLMGGTIGVESAVGIGSEFWFELASVAEPRLSAIDHEVLAEPDLRERKHVRTLLYVEDNPANLNLVVQIMARLPDIQLLTAVDGLLGVEMAREAQPDLILMDINLPGISGFEALRILRIDPTTAHIPVIAISADAMPCDIEKGLMAGFAGYLTKPIRVSELLDSLRLTPSGGAS
ncbi:MAG: response regulator [Holophaga sp.]|nr:response regulator [Holophaga sp.]